MLPVFAKLNITLRVTGQRPDGYHDLVSAFLRIPSGETLFVTPLPPGSGNVVEVQGMDLRLEEDGAKKENLVAKALRLAREAGADVPPLRVEIAKALYPGAGLGAGSGNAAALLQWLASEHPDISWLDVAHQTGADVPFLLSALPAALVSGIGDQMEPLDDAPYVRGMVVFPEWEAHTANAYAALDAHYGGWYPLDEEEAREEWRDIWRALVFGEGVGLLPNDFLPPLMKVRPEYAELFDLFEDLGCLAWGLTGSGSAAFALLRLRTEPIRWPTWVRQVLYIPPMP